MPPRVLSCVLFLAATASLCQQPDTSQVAGRITRVASATDFDVKGIHVVLTPTTQIGLERAHSVQSTATYSVLQLAGRPLPTWGHTGGGLRQDRHKKALDNRNQQHVCTYRKPHETFRGLGILDVQYCPSRRMRRRPAIAWCARMDIPS